MARPRGTLRSAKGDHLTDENSPPRERVARLSWLAVGLIGLTLVLLLLALWAAWRAGPREIVGQLPLVSVDNLVGVWLLLAAGAGGAAYFVGLAALHVAAAMRVLARDRRIPHALSPEQRKLRAVLLTPLGPAA